MQKKIKPIVIIFISLFLTLCVAYAASWHGWKLFGFNACINPESLYFLGVDSSKDKLYFNGTSGVDGPAFVGYTYEIIDDNLYIGMKYSSLFGFTKPNGRFDVEIPCDTDSIEKIYITNGKTNMLLWAAERPNLNIDTVSAISISNSMMEILDDGDGKDVFVEMLKAGKNPENTEEPRELIVDVQVTALDENGDKIKTYVFIMRRESDGAYFAMYDSKTLQIDVEAFLTLLDSYGDEYYKYANLPQCIFEVSDKNGVLTKHSPGLVESDYFYRTLSGRQKRLDYTAAPALNISLTSDDKFLVDVDWYPSEVEYILSTNGAVVWSGSYVNNLNIGDFGSDGSGMYVLDIRAKFENESYYCGGSAAWSAIINWS